MSLIICSPEALPNTSRSSSELVPRRLAPCTETQAHSPAAYRPGHDGFLARALGNDHLPHVIGGHAAHLVVHRRHHRDRLADRVDVGELDRDLADSRQAQVDHLGSQMIQLQQHMVGVGPAAAAFLDLGGHGARHHVAARQVLGVRRVALHEALAALVEQVAALAAHALGDQHPGAGDAGGVELPELHVFERQPGARHHADAVAGIDERVGVAQ